MAHFMKEFPNNMQGHGTVGGTNPFYAIKNRQEQKDLPDAVIGMI